MTNERKFLNNNVSAYEFSMAFNLWCFNNKGLGTSQADKMQLFLNSEVKPTLTEDERVILRNIDTRQYPTIKRTRIGEIIVISNAKCGDDIICYMYCYDHLFQFIKERRRI